MPLDLTAAPPSTAGRTSARNAKASGSKGSNVLADKTSTREDAMNGLVQLGTFGLIITKQYADAGAIKKHGPGLVHEIAVAAEKDVKLAKAIDSTASVGPYGAIIAAAMPLVLQLLANHKVLNGDLTAVGVISPAALAAEAKAEEARQTAAALRMQQEAEQELANAAADTARLQAQMAPQAVEAPNGQTPATMGVSA